MPRMQDSIGLVALYNLDRHLSYDSDNNISHLCFSYPWRAVKVAGDGMGRRSCSNVISAAA